MNKMVAISKKMIIKLGEIETASLIIIYINLIIFLLLLLRTEFGE